MFGKKKKRMALLNNLDQEFLKIQQRYHLPAGDFPNPEKFKKALELYDIDKFKTIQESLLHKVDDVSVKKKSFCFLWENEKIYVYIANEKK